MCCGKQQEDGWEPCEQCGCHDWNPLRFVVHGAPVSQKNSREIVHVKLPSGKVIPKVVANKQVKAWHESARLQLKFQGSRQDAAELGGEDRELITTIVAYLGSGQHIDPDNIAAAPLDALQRAGIVTNDYWCAPLHVFRERDTRDPRIEITLEPLGRVQG